MSEKIKVKKMIYYSDGTKDQIEYKTNLLCIKYSIKSSKLKKWFETTVMYPPSKRRTYFAEYMNKRFHKVPMIKNVISIMKDERLKIENYLQEKEKSV